MIWIILCLNLLTMAVAFKKRMILYVLLNAIFLFLVTGQAFQIAADLQTTRTVNYLLNFISDVGFDLGLKYVFWTSVVSLVLALVSPGFEASPTRKSQYSFAPGKSFYLGLFLFLSVLSALLIFVVVGVDQFLHSSRPGFQSGSTIFLVLLFLGVVPVLLKNIHGGKIGPGDLYCCALSFGVTGFFSRTDVILYLVTILLSLYYSGGWFRARLTVALILRYFAFGGAVAFIVLVIGALHDAQNFTKGSLGDIVSFILDHPEKSLLSIEYNYRVGIEGMSGIGGIFSEYLSHPDLAHYDFGSSWIIQGTIQWLPGFLKPFASGMNDLSQSLNWYPSSIIATGSESFFMSFGWAAVVLYPVSVYLLGWYLPIRMLRSRLSPASGVTVYLLMACTIFFVHGPLAVWIGFSFSYTAILLAFWFVFRRQFRPIVEEVEIA